MSLFRPRTIRGQLIGGLVLLEGLLFLVFTSLAVREHYVDVRARADRRLEYQVSMFAAEATYALADHRPDRLADMPAVTRNSPTIVSVQVTDTQGRVMASSRPFQAGAVSLSPFELRQLPQIRKATIFTAAGGGHREAAGPIFVDSQPAGYVWIYSNSAPDQRDLRQLLLLTVLYSLAGVGGCTIVGTLLARSVTRPLKVILDTTRHLVQYPEDTSQFPLTLATANEAADLATGLNLMVAAIEEQRAGLNDTLALLDSMQANAPIGFAFFDRGFKLVRINQFLADLNHKSVSMHLGRTLAEILPPGIAEPMQNCIEQVFETNEPVRDVELTHSGPPSLRGSLQSPDSQGQTWLGNFYPVKTGAQAVRWVGAIIVDTTERKRSEDALRKTEKLAAAGRLAASIAHEINNPLEAVTNLLYLLRHHPSLDSDALAYAELAQNEVARVSEITQQTLRFYRQSTRPLMSSITDLLDSVLVLHEGRVHRLQIEVARKYIGNTDLFCFAGELRQLFANLIGNALDAMTSQGGKLTLAVRRSRSWRDPSIQGIRIFVADTGMGMDESVRRRIFEPFFTTKEMTGTGLGLWVSAEIIQKHAGTVRVRSRAASPSTTALDNGNNGTMPEKSTPATGTIFMMFFPENAVAAALQPATMAQRR